jgi:hypothetical protein
MYTIIASSITLPGKMNIWTFDTREEAGVFILSKAYEAQHWHMMHLSIYESIVNSGIPAILSLQSIEDFYKISILDTVSAPACRCLDAQMSCAIADPDQGQTE